MGQCYGKPRRTDKECTPLMCCGEDIHHSSRQRELREFRPSVDFLQRHPELTGDLRMLLVDWLVVVSVEHRLCDETLHLAVGYLDRYLSLTKGVKGSELPLVGTAALMLASAKYEMIGPENLRRLLHITDDDNLMEMEINILEALDFQLSEQTIHHFLKQYMTIQPVFPETESLARYVSDLSLMAVDPFVQYCPSVVAAAAYCLANYSINTRLWPASLESYTGYTLAELAPCLNELHKLYKTAKTLPWKAINGKYNSSMYDYVSQKSAPVAIPLFSFTQLDDDDL